MPLHGNGWRPTSITRFVQSFETAARTARVDTDDGEGYIKALGTPEGPHILACELVGSLLAEWLGLPTLDFAIIRVSPEDEIPLSGGGNATAGPAFISRAEDKGFSWGGTQEELAAVHNPLAISSLVVLDTWLLNCDRYAPNRMRENRDNVFLVQRSDGQKGTLLKAMDFTHAFTCGRDIGSSIRHIDTVKDERVYGLFPQFQRLLDRSTVRQLASRLGEFTADNAVAFIEQVPQEWEVGDSAKSAWAAMITQRAHFLSTRVETMLWPQRKLS